MPSKTNPTAIRFPPEMRVRIDHWAQENGKSAHAAVLMLVAAGLGDAPPPKPAPKPRPRKASGPKEVKLPLPKVDIPDTMAQLAPYNPPRQASPKGVSTKKRWSI